MKSRVKQHLARLLRQQNRPVIPPPPPLADSTNEPKTLSSLLGGADRFVVLDTETTGVYSTDRVVEIALVTMSPNGDILDVWDTLLQPERAVTATHIHGVTASMVAGAPTFDDIAGDVAVRMQGAAIIAHNLPFDYRMINAEFARVGGSLDIPAGIDTLSATRLKLAVACAKHGVAIGEQHRARDDALATAQLARTVSQTCKAGSPAAAPQGLQRTGRVLHREDVVSAPLPDPHPIADLAARLEYDIMEPAVLVYLEVLGRAVDDLHFDRKERKELEFIARSVGLDEAHVAQAHRRFINEMIDAALADHVLTSEEYDALLRVGAALDVDQGRIETRIRPFQYKSSRTEIKSGMRVVLTGEHPNLDRAEVTDRLALMGLTVQNSVTKTTDLLATADPASNSRKAEKARRCGIPIVPIEGLLAATIDTEITAITTKQALKVITCPECLATWTEEAVSSKHAQKRCNDCNNVTDNCSVPHEKTHTDIRSPKTGNSATEQLVCLSCQNVWERVRVRGRKPKICPSCVG